MSPTIHTLPQKKRQFIFISMVVIFVVSIPLLILYASGYRFDFAKETAIVQTGGVYVASDQTGVLMFIDDELVRETRTFRKALYASGVVAGPHRVTVQKDGYHTWVKEIDVVPYLVVDAFAFNLPEIEVRVPVAASTELHKTLLKIFTQGTDEAAASATSTPIKTLGNIHSQIEKLRLGDDDATAEIFVPTHEKDGVQLFSVDDDIYARYVGPLSKMPYYYCPKVRVASSNATATVLDVNGKVSIDDKLYEVSSPVVCDPTVRLDRQNMKVNKYDFSPGVTDHVIIGREDGIFLTEIDNRGFQNTQPLAVGQNLNYTLYNNDIYLYDGEIISQLIIE